MNNDTYYVMTDIHGRKDLLDLALAEIYSRQDSGKIIFLGDYIDRGQDSPGVVDTVMLPPPAGWEFVCLKGNHEDMFTHNFMTATEYYDPKVAADYGGTPPVEVIMWMNSLKLYHIEDDNLFVHADWNEDLPPSQQTEVRMLWTRRERNQSFFHPTLYLTHGHTPQHDGPRFTPNRCNLDCGAFYTNNLCVGVYQRGHKGPVTTFTVTNK